MVMSFDKIWNSKCCKDMTQDERWNIYGSWFKEWFKFDINGELSR